MYLSRLKRFVVICLVSFSALSAKAQQKHFIYLQTDNGQPFYVRLNNKLISSSAAGYVILPNLASGDYQLIVGFPRNEYPETGYKVSVDKSNEGFLLKDFGEKGWGLFDMQSLSIVYAGTGNATVPVATPPKAKEDPFSSMLANVVKDSSILQNNSTVTVSQDTPVKNKVALVETPTLNETPQIPPSGITRISNEKDKQGMQMVYIDKAGSASDTVRVFMPVEKKLSKKEANPDENKEVLAESNPVDIAAVDTSALTITPTLVHPEPDTLTLVNDTIRIYKEPKAPEKNSSIEEKKDTSTKKAEANPFVTIIEPATKDTSAKKAQANPFVTLIEPAAATQEEKISGKKKKDEMLVLPKAITSSSVNSDCRDFATDADFLKLRKKMAAENDNEAMIRSAKKIFRSKCFSTEQIKNLSYLFLTDEGKYMFFDAAYPFTSDSDQFHQLGSQLSDEYYINRFNAMIHK